MIPIQMYIFHCTVLILSKVMCTTFNSVTDFSVWWTSNLGAVAGLMSPCFILLTNNFLVVNGGVELCLGDKGGSCLRNGLYAWLRVPETIKWRISATVCYACWYLNMIFYFTVPFQAAIDNLVTARRTAMV